MADPVGERRHSFGRDPWAYQRARPPYPPEVYEVLTGHCGLAPGRRVLEIGPGTGQATAALLAHGAEVVAVEPGAGLARVLRSRLGGPRLRVVTADFETAALPPGRYDLVVSATAFHWLDAATVLPRIAGLLPPGGPLVVWWTVFGDPDRPTAFRTDLDAAYARYLPDERRDRRPGPLRVRSWTGALRQGGWFGPVTVDLIRWSQPLTPTTARRLWASFPNVAGLAPPDRAGFLDRLGRLAADHAGPDGTVADPRVTAVYRTRRLAGPR